MRACSTLVLLAVLAVLGNAPAEASCRNSPGNLLASANCGFDKDTAGWTSLASASVQHKPADRGVMEAVADSQGSLIVVGPCVTAKPSTAYSLGARLRSAKGVAYFCSVNVFQYSDDRCSEGGEPLGSAAGPPTSDWATLEGSATTSGNAKSIQLRPTCSGEPGFTVNFDDFVVAKN